MHARRNKTALGARCLCVVFVYKVSGVVVVRRIPPHTHGSPASSIIETPHASVNNNKNTNEHDNAQMNL